MDFTYVGMRKFSSQFRDEHHDAAQFTRKIYFNIPSDTDSTELGHNELWE